MFASQAGDWLVYYNPDRRIWPANLHNAMMTTRPGRLVVSSNAAKITDVTATLLMSPH
jgi:ribosomal protein L28